MIYVCIQILYYIFLLNTSALVVWLTIARNEVQIANLHYIIWRPGIFHMFYTEDILVTVKLATSGGGGGGYESDVDFEKRGQVKNEIYYDNMDDLNFSIVNFRFICKCCNIPAAFAYEIYIVTIYSRACGSNNDFFERVELLARTLLSQGS